MNFRTASKYHQLSDCGRYSVCKASIDGLTWQYQAWLIGTKGWPAQIVHGDCESARQAQQACVDHAADQPAHSGTGAAA